MLRSRRLTLIAQLLSGHRYGSQEELARALDKSGVTTTQATLSRDLRSLGVVKRADATGRTGYELPGPATEAIDRERRTLDLKAFVNEVRRARNLLIVRTPPGHANAVGRAIDLAEFDAVVGTVAGDDTVLIVLQSDPPARRLERRLQALSTGVAK